MIIYKVKNIITEEVYIGQTKKKLCERKRDHVYEALDVIRQTSFIQHFASLDDALLNGVF